MKFCDPMMFNFFDNFDNVRNVFFKLVPNLYVFTQHLHLQNMAAIFFQLFWLQLLKITMQELPIHTKPYHTAHLLGLPGLSPPLPGFQVWVSQQPMTAKLDAFHLSNDNKQINKNAILNDIKPSKTTFFHSSRVRTLHFSPIIKFEN